MKPHFKKESELWQLGFDFICGIDEAGRGAIAGPLVAGAVILKQKTKKIYNDSKLLTKKSRSELFEIIQNKAVSWSVGVVDVEEINRYGIQSATYLSYKRAIDSLAVKPSFLLIDHYRLPATDIPQASITKGDRISQSIAAASIVAKVYRDELMANLEKTMPGYCFAVNCGYGTKGHFEAISNRGLSSEHREGFVDKAISNQLNFI